MARRTILALALAALAAALCSASAFAHAGNSKFESRLRVLTPPIDGLSAAVLNGDDRLQVVNSSPQTITIDGYNEEPYVRMEPGGTVSVNVRSPAWFLNDDRDGTKPVPASADAGATPVWKVIARDGRYEFHDHRIHWMAKNDPPQVRDASARTKVFDWSVPLHAGAADGAIAGTLYWRGSGGDAPVGAFAALGLLVLLSVVVVVVVRRRRRAGAGPGKPAPEAW